MKREENEDIIRETLFRKKTTHASQFLPGPGFKV